MGERGDFRSTASPQTLQLRANLLRQTRAFFDSRGFTEVQTPVLSADTVVDRHLDPVPVLLPHDPSDLESGRAMYLQSSPEFLMKRLVASGMTSIYQIAPAFRIGESGEQHNPEFTMLEWYRCGDDMHAGMQLLADFAVHILQRDAVGVATVAATCESILGFNPLTETGPQLKQRCVDNAIAHPSSLDPQDWDSWFDLLFASLVQPRLGCPRPAILHDYPASQAALARIRNTDHGPVAERFELFVDGVELANGYHELLDPAELRRRNRAVNHQRCEDGKSPLPEDSLLIDAMEAGLPACSGVAVGFDRLVMLAANKRTIADVLSFPLDRA